MAASIVDVINTKGSIVNSLILNNPNVCSEFKTTILKGAELGSGVQGVVNDVDISRNPNLQKNISIPGLSNTDYIIKTILVPEIEHKYLGRLKTVDRAIRDIIDTDPSLVYDVQLAYNGGDPNRMVKVIKIIKEAKDCLYEDPNPYVFSKNDGTNQDMNIESGNYLCSNSSYSEYMIGVLCSSLSEYLNNERGFGCRNFVYITDFATCTSSDNFLQYIFMEKIDVDLKTLMIKPELLQKLGTITEVDDIPAILFQCLFAIYTYEFMYQMNHNDLHPGNVFIRELPSIKYLRYEYKQIMYYIPCKYIVKIGDFGMSCKYSDPMILNELIIMDGYGGVIPNFYNTTYDVMCLLLYLLHLKSGFVTYILEDNGLSVENMIQQKLLQPKYPRPKLDKLDTAFSNMNAERLLSKYFTRFTIKPRTVEIDDMIYMGRMI